MIFISLLISLSAKIALLGGILWFQLFLLRRAPAALRSRLCVVALAAIVLLMVGEAVAPGLVKSPQFTLVTTAVAGARAALPQTSLSSNVTTGLAGLWALGVLFMVLRAFVGRTALATTRRRATRLESIGGVEVRIADVQAPMLSGLREPTILLPASARAWTDEQRRMVVTHELTHHRQGDVWTNLLAQMLRAVFWFHPVVWLLIARLSREQELTCDEAVVAAGHPAHEYAAFLLAAVRGLRSHDLLACSMAGSGAKSLKQRFASLLDPTPRRPMRIGVLVAGLVCFSAALTTVRPVWAQAAEKKVYKVGNGVVSPKLLTKTEPKYTQEARDAKISGPVRLQVVVNAQGIAEDIKVVQGLDPGLDKNAIDAVTQWTFQPATKDGVAVAVQAVIEVNFRLQ